MRKFTGYRATPRAWFFDKAFPVLFTVMFTLGLVGALAQFAVVGYAGYKAVTDPTGTANFVGNVVGELIVPIAEAARGE